MAGPSLHAEHGMGDTIQFCRYAKLVAARGATVLLEVPPALEPLLVNLDGVSRLLARGRDLPAFDCHCPLMSLPLAFGTRLDTIPADVPYLGSDAGRVAKWQARLGDRNGREWDWHGPATDTQKRPQALAAARHDGGLISDKAQYVACRRKCGRRTSRC